jgi:D-beta-D-heptose 7-phosphate kinase/D-beta-D-heptose 1-phosphate adenosyltransferase
MNTQQQKLLNVLLIGETCDDEYIYGDVNRISPEAPVPVLKYTHTEIFSGMSSNVKNNLNSFGVNVVHVTNKEKIVKTRVVHNGTNQQLLRIDNDSKVSSIKPSEVRSAFLHFSYDAIVISDYDKGLLTIEDLKVICQNFNGPVFIDTKKKELFSENNVIFKINQREYDNLMIRPNEENLIVTMGGVGAKYIDRIYPSEKVNVFDVVGAGDTFLAAFVYSYLTSLNDAERIASSIIYANKAAAIAVQHFGSYTLTIDDIRSLNNDILFGS